MEIIIIKLKNEKNNKKKKTNDEKWTTRIVSIGERATAAIARRLKVEQRNRKDEPKKQKHEWITKPANLRRYDRKRRRETEIYNFNVFMRKFVGTMLSQPH